MAKKVLKVAYPEKCINCELCVFEVMRQLGKVGVESSPIRVLGYGKETNIHLDPSINEFDIKKIAQICPRGCFTIEEVSEEEGAELPLKEDE